MMRRIWTVRWPLLLYIVFEALTYVAGQRVYGNQPGTFSVSAHFFKSAPIQSERDDGFTFTCASGDHIYLVFAGSIERVVGNKWAFSLLSSQSESPSTCVAEGDRVYVPRSSRSDEGEGPKLFAFTSEGKQLWAASVGENPEAIALGNDGEIIVSGYLPKQANVRFLEKISPSGESLWQVATSDVLLGVGPDGTIYCRRHQGGLVAYQPNGVERWVSNPTTSDIVAPAFDSQGDIYVTDWQGVYALDKRGVLRWQRTSRGNDPGADAKEQALMRNAELGGGVGTDQVTIANDDTIYLAGRSLYALTRDGAIKWVFTPETRFTYGDSISTHFTRPPIIARDGTLYITTYDHQVYALDSSGKALWREAGNRFDEFGAFYLEPSGKLHLMDYVSKDVQERKTRHVVFATADHGGLMQHAWPVQNHDFGNSRHRSKGD